MIELVAGREKSEQSMGSAQTNDEKDSEIEETKNNKDIESDSAVEYCTTSCGRRRIEKRSRVWELW